MDRSDVIILVKDTYMIDPKGQRIPAKVPRTVFCDVSSVTGTEWFSGANNGMRPEYRITMFAYDYDGETEANYGGEIDNGIVLGGIDYTIYRTYKRATDELELYLERRTGS